MAMAAPCGTHRLVASGSLENLPGKSGLAWRKAQEDTSGYAG